MRVLLLGNYIEAHAFCTWGEWGIGFWLTLLDGRTLTTALHVGPFDVGFEAYLPIGRVEEEPA